MSKTKYSAEEVEEAKEMLKKYLPRDDKNKPVVYAAIRSVAKSGMSRRIDFYSIARDCNGKDYMQYLTGYIAKVLDYSRDINKPGILVQGCGMDMSFSIVYDLSSALYGDGYSIRKEDI